MICCRKVSTFRPSHSSITLVILVIYLFYFIFLFLISFKMHKNIAMFKFTHTYNYFFLIFSHIYIYIYTHSLSLSVSRSTPSRKMKEHTHTLQNLVVKRDQKKTHTHKTHIPRVNVNVFFSLFVYYLIVCNNIFQTIFPKNTFNKLFLFETVIFCSVSTG